MFQAFETGSKISKEDYKKRLPDLRSELLEMQFALKEHKIPMIIIMSGVEGAGKGEAVNRINEWMDVRDIETHFFKIFSDEEKVRPEYWRYWRIMPAKGKAGIFFGSWYTRPIVQYASGQSTMAEYEAALNRIRFVEQMLTDDGVLLVKIWLHLSKKDQYKRFKSLEKDKRTRFRVTEQDWKYHETFDHFVSVSERAIRTTDTHYALWKVIDASDERFRDIAIAELILESIKKAIHKQSIVHTETAPLELGEKLSKHVNVLSTIEFPTIEGDDTYKKRFREVALNLQQLAWKCHEEQISTVIVFEGWDAAGKGGAIRRVVASLDAKFFRVIQTAAPTDEEKAHHYLWRFWRHIPRDGNFTIYDRSWYGRILVERVEGFAKEAEWRRAYLEINEFEQQLVDHGTNVIKFWMHISDEEQLRRFEERAEIKHKQYKITDEDWRNRDKWPQYMDAVHEMIVRTDTEYARWHIIPNNDKDYGRLKVLEIIAETLKKSLKRKKELSKA